MPLKRRTEHRATAFLLFSASLAALCLACAGSGGSSQPPAPSPPALPDDVQSAAKAPFGDAGEALAYGDFSAAGGRQVLVVHRLPGAPHLPAVASSSPQLTETSADVIRVSLLVREGQNWQQAFRADGHLTNRRGYLDGSAIPIPAWHMVCEKTPDSGFRLEFTGLDLPPGSKPVSVRVAWNPKRREYDALDSWGTRFLEPLATPGGLAIKVVK